MPRLPYDPHREDSESLLLSKEVSMAQDERMSPWGGEHDPSQSLHSEGGMDYTNSEQLVPGQVNYQPQRYVITCYLKPLIKHKQNFFSLDLLQQWTSRDSLDVV